MSQSGASAYGYPQITGPGAHGGKLGHTSMHNAVGLGAAVDFGTPQRRQQGTYGAGGAGLAPFGAATPSRSSLMQQMPEQQPLGFTTSPIQGEDLVLFTPSGTRIYRPPAPNRLAPLYAPILNSLGQGPSPQRSHAAGVPDNSSSQTAQPQQFGGPEVQITNPSSSAYGSFNQGTQNAQRGPSGQPSYAVGLHQNYLIPVQPDDRLLLYRSGSSDLYVRGVPGQTSLRYRDLMIHSKPQLRVVLAEHYMPFSETCALDRPAEWGVLKLDNVSDIKSLIAHSPCQVL